MYLLILCRLCLVNHEKVKACCLSCSTYNLQSTGEAVFVDDIPSPPHCLHGAFIYGTNPAARVKCISFDDPQPSEIAAVFSAKDIPRGGENIGCMAIFGTEPLFADGISRFAGDLIAFVVCYVSSSSRWLGSYHF